MDLWQANWTYHGALQLTSRFASGGIARTLLTPVQSWAFFYQGEALKKRVGRSQNSLGSDIVLPL